jgi:predicted O-methyltransferase YrrM
MKIESTYTEKFGDILYDKVMEYRPKVICDIGVLHGFSTYHLARAAKKIGSKVIAVDLFEDYEFNHGTLDGFINNMKLCGVYDVVEVVQQDYYNWLSTSKPNLDMIHLDVSNTGETILHLLDVVVGEPKILFEGGTASRDNVDWMTRYDKPKIIDTLNANDRDFKVLYEEKYQRNGREYNPCLSELF